MWKQASQAENQTCVKVHCRNKLPHSCVNPHNPPGEQSFSTYTGLRSRFPSDCSHCAQPPSNLEVNPPQTSTSMPCFLWLPACMFSTDFSSARCICPICGRQHIECFNLLHLLHTIFLPKSKRWKLALRMNSNIFTQTVWFKNPMDCSD